MKKQLLALASLGVVLAACSSASGPDEGDSDTNDETEVVTDEALTSGPEAEAVAAATSTHGTQKDHYCVRRNGPNGEYARICDRQFGYFWSRWGYGSMSASDSRIKIALHEVDVATDFKCKAIWSAGPIGHTYVNHWTPQLDTLSGDVDTYVGYTITWTNGTKSRGLLDVNCGVISLSGGDLGILCQHGTVSTSTNHLGFWISPSSQSSIASPADVAGSSAD